MVPLRAVCGKCDVVLYEGTEIKASSEIILGYDGKCPKCGRKLSFIPKKVEIRIANEVGNLRRLNKRKRR
jgi:hypothetical protein